MTNFILCGFKGCGKTTLGKMLAKKLGYSFLDTDDLISLNTRDLYQQAGKKAFRLAEKKAIASLDLIQNTVVATGGGAILDKDNVAILKKIGKIIYLKERKDVLKARFFKKPYPAFFQGKDVEQEFEAMYAERYALYESSADYIVKNQEQLWAIIHLAQSFKSQPGESLMEKPWEF